jgi:hypothetical protein
VSRFDVRVKGALAIEGLEHLALRDLAQAAGETVEDVTEGQCERALSRVVKIERATQAAVMALGRAPRWCGVYQAVAEYRDALSALVEAQS